MKASILSRLKNPNVIGSLKLRELVILAEEIRERISVVVNKIGGHLGPNLGVVEIIIACHYVFNFSKDKLVFDVGHQVYPHKILTGRNDQFETLRQKSGLSGYPSQKESLYDTFRGGHASTAISTALGLKRGNTIATKQKNSKNSRNSRKSKNSKENVNVVALVGDGAMTGGMTFEGLNHAGYLNDPLIVILNDNSMSISPTVGALSKAFNYLRHLDIYRNIRDTVQDKFKHIPKVGQRVYQFTDHILKDIQNIVNPSQIFTILGFDYIGPVNGHNIREMIKSLKTAKKLKRPVIIHAVTQKGLGYTPDGKNGKTILGPHALSAKPSVKKPTDVTPQPSYSKVFADSLINLAKRMPKLVAVTAAMPEGTGLAKFAEQFPNQYFDVGICEAHATGFSAGLAASNCRPVFAVYSTFFQRAFDQIFHDIILQETFPVVFCIDRAGLVGDDGPSHHGLYDIAYLKIFPNMIVMAPKDAAELNNMLKFALQQKTSVAIRYPKALVPLPNQFKVQNKNPSSPIRLGKSEKLLAGKHVCILAYGSMVLEASLVCERLQKIGIHPTLVNARFVKPFDKTLLKALLKEHKVILTLEEASQIGGFGSAVLEASQQLGNYQVPIKVLGVPDRLIEHASRSQQLKMCGLDVETLTKVVKQLWNQFSK